VRTFPRARRGTAGSQITTFAGVVAVSQAVLSIFETGAMALVVGVDLITRPARGTLFPGELAWLVAAAAMLVLAVWSLAVGIKLLDRVEWARRAAVWTFGLQAVVLAATVVVAGGATAPWLVPSALACLVVAVLAAGPDVRGHVASVGQRRRAGQRRPAGRR
jgi:hypothetical protein